MYGKKNGNKKFSRVFNIESLYVPSEVSLIKCRKLKIVAGTCEKKCWKELKFSLLFWPEILLDLKTQPIDSCARFFALTEFEPAQVFRVIHWKFSLVCPTPTERFEENSLPRSVSTWRLLVGVCTLLWYSPVGVHAFQECLPSLEPKTYKRRFEVPSLGIVLFSVLV